MTQSVATNSETEPFRQQLLTALENFTDPAWLGKHSPLATPYFLGEYLLQRQGEKGTAVSRGCALQKLLLETAQTLVEQEEDGRYLYRLLDLTFFRPHSLTQILYELNISKSTFYRPPHRPRAIQQFEQALIQRLKPALRLEKPPVWPQDMVERQVAIQSCQQQLENGHTIAITGSGGMGKTALAACLANKWAPRPLFWFIIRPGLNDELRSFLFSLGYFLQRQGVSSLWLQLMADPGNIASEVILGLIRRDLSKLQNTPPLLCIDEVDLLRPSDVEAHKQLLAFFSSLHGLAPILLIGQQIPMEVDWRISLQGLSLPAIEKMLAQAGIQLSSTDLATLQAYTEGNPRLLKLFITLHHSGEKLADVLARMSTAPSLEYLLNRIWQRLGEEEQNLLALLSVFRRSAPRETWPTQTAIDALTSQNLVQTDDQGSINLLPAFKAVIYHLLAPEVKERLHLMAADIRTIHGEYTAAAYHYIAGGQPEMAIWLWYNHRQQEIDQGQGHAALQLFAGLSRNHFREPERELLVLLRSELRLLAGSYREIKADLYATLWQNPVLKGRANRIQGDVAYEQSRFDEAIRAYGKGLEIISTAGSDLALFHKDIGKAYWQKRDLEQAWHEVLLACYEVEHLQGDIQEAKGNYSEARHHYEKALSLAEKLDFTEGEGKTRNNLAWMLLRQGEFKAATLQWDQASRCYEQVGRLNWQAGIKINQAIAYTETGQPKMAIPLLEEAQSVFSSLEHIRGKALVAFNLAEAHFALGTIELAEHFAWQAIQHEEISLMPASLNMLARIRLAQQKFSEAAVFCHKSIESAKQNQNLFSEGCSWRTLGEVYLGQNELNQGRIVLEKATTIFEELQLSHEVEMTKTIMQKYLT